MPKLTFSCACPISLTRGAYIYKRPGLTQV
jgi:hypothetical protein